MPPHPLGIKLGVCGLVALEHPVVLLLGLCIVPAQLLKVRIYFAGYLKGRIIPLIKLAHGLEGFLPQRLAMGAGLALLSCAIAYLGVHDYERGMFGVRLSIVESGLYSFHILAGGYFLYLPAVSLKPRLHVLAKGGLYPSLYGYMVAVVDQYQLAEAHGACHGSGLGSNAFLKAAVAAKGVGVIVNYLVAVAVEVGGKPAFCHGHAYRYGDALPKRAAGSFNALGVAVLRVTGGKAAPLAEVL